MENFAYDIRNSGGNSINRIAQDRKFYYDETMQKITELHLKHLHTLINDGLKKGAEVLNSMLSSPIELEASA